ncbi:MAG: thermonuclease family protein [Pseudomonadota bacterium]
MSDQIVRNTTFSTAKVAVALAIALPLAWSQPPAAAPTSPAPAQPGPALDPDRTLILIDPDGRYMTGALVPRRATRLTGRARVVDGDTLDLTLVTPPAKGAHRTSSPAGPGRAMGPIDGGSAVGAPRTVRIRLEGIDAPEAAQTCARAARPRGLRNRPANAGGPGDRWACGAAATRHLRHLIGSARVHCNVRRRDGYGRLLAQCYAGARDLNASMVRAGLAWAFVKYSKRFARLERATRSQRRGVFQAPTRTPWAYRETRWAQASDASPRGCAIKGNISPHGRIYHPPWSRWYGRIRIELAKGERWFCSEAEALRAGWRPVRQR